MRDRTLDFGSRRLLYFARRRVARLGYDRVLDRLAFLVVDAERLVGGGIHQLDLDLAVLAVLGGVGRRIAEGVLVAQRFVNGPVDGWEFPIKAWEEGLSARLLGESAH